MELGGLQRVDHIPHLMEVIPVQLIQQLSVVQHMQVNGFKFNYQPQSS
jgi:hypothetical protein